MLIPIIGQGSGHQDISTRVVRSLGPLTRPIPPEADLVIAILRRDVTPPDYLPTSLVIGSYVGALRWDVKKPFRGFPSLDVVRCDPMGLHPRARHPIPVDGWHFYGLDSPIFNAAVKAFALWWDGERDPTAAVAAVWGTVEEQQSFSPGPLAGHKAESPRL